jgi:hypothetical protein
LREKLLLWTRPRVGANGNKRFPAVRAIYCRVNRRCRRSPHLCRLSYLTAAQLSPSMVPANGRAAPLRREVAMTVNRHRQRCFREGNTGLRRRDNDKG